MFVCLFVEGAERGLSRAVGRPTPRGVYPELEQGSSDVGKAEIPGGGGPLYGFMAPFFDFRFSVFRRFPLSEFCLKFNI